MMTSNPDVYYKYYHYLPSLAAACIFAVLFGALTIWQAILIIKRKTWYFLPVVVGGVCKLRSWALAALVRFA